jgi:hypothetical protein
MHKISSSCPCQVSPAKGFFAGDDCTDLNALLEIEQLRKDGLTAYTVVVRHHDTLPALLEHTDEIVDGVEEMAAKLQEIAAQL